MKNIMRLIRLSMIFKVIFIILISAYYILNNSIFITHSWAGAEKASNEASHKNGKAGKGTASGDMSLNIEDLKVHRKIKQILWSRVKKIEERERELDEREKDLNLLKKEVEDRLAEIKKLQEGLSGPIKKAQKENEARFSHLVGVYSSMDPQRAALLLEKMEEDTVVKLFSSMKSKKVAKILSFMNPDKAASISSRLSRAGIGGF